MESILESLAILSLNDSIGGSLVTEASTNGKRPATASADVTSILQAPYGVTAASMRSLLHKLNFQLLAILHEGYESVCLLESAREGAKAILLDHEAVLEAWIDQIRIGEVNSNHHIVKNYNQAVTPACSSDIAAILQAPLSTITGSSMMIIRQKMVSQRLAFVSKASEYKNRIYSVCERIKALVIDTQTILAWFENVHPTAGTASVGVEDIMTMKASFAEILSQVLVLHDQRPADVGKANIKHLVEGLRQGLKELAVKKQSWINFLQQRQKQ